MNSYDAMKIIRFWKSSLVVEPRTTNCMWRPSWGAPYLVNWHLPQHSRYYAYESLLKLKVYTKMCPRILQGVFMIYNQGTKNKQCVAKCQETNDTLMVTNEDADLQLFIKYTSFAPFYESAVIEWYILLWGRFICAWAIRHLKSERLMI